jgi:O-antigen/teichoic acid export membrane protein
VLARLKNLLGNLAVYGIGDVAISLVSLLLLPIFTRFLSPSDYGVLAMLITVEAVMKIAFRWGVDTAFMRLYYDCRDTRGRQELASTIFFFLLAVNGAVLALSILAANWFSGVLFGSANYGMLVALTVANIFLGGFFFIPLQVLRISQLPRQYIALTFGRSAATVVLRLALVVWARMGVSGIVFADIIVTMGLALVLVRWFAPLIRPLFSRTILREALSFGLPRIPHSLAHQVMSVADRYFLNAYGTLRDVGLYSIGATFGLAPKLFLSAFESAWTPFFLESMEQRDAKRIYSTVSTYIVAILVLIVAGLSAVAQDLVRLATDPQFLGSAAVIPWIALGALFQGLYLVGSIGIVITKQTRLYPLTTGCAAAASLLANAVLIPRYGLMGAAWANTLAYATLAVVTVGFSLRAYYIPYEWVRLLKLTAAGAVSYAVTEALVPATVPPAFGLVLRAVLVTAVYVGVLALTRFFKPGEFRALADLRRRGLDRRDRAAD